jgi:hypothetical protein
VIIDRFRQKSWRWRRGSGARSTTVESSFAS